MDPRQLSNQWMIVVGTVNPRGKDQVGKSIEP